MSKKNQKTKKSTTNKQTKQKPQETLIKIAFI
jgi:hypothetical protein